MNTEVQIIPEILRVNELVIDFFKVIWLIILFLQPPEAVAVSFFAVRTINEF